MFIDIMTENLLPTTFIESSSVRAFLKFVEPDYKPPCRQTATHRLLSKKDALVTRMKAHMKSSASDISVTIDIWTRVTNKAYMSITATYLTPEWQVMNVVLDSVVLHELHTLEHISVKLGEIAQDWDIHEKIFACVHDRASNCKVAEAVNSWRDVHCAAHPINLAVMSAM